MNMSVDATRFEMYSLRQECGEYFQLFCHCSLTNNEINNLLRQKIKFRPQNTNKLIISK